MEFQGVQEFFKSSFRDQFQEDSGILSGGSSGVASEVFSATPTELRYSCRSSFRNSSGGLRDTPEGRSGISFRNSFRRSFRIQSRSSSWDSFWSFFSNSCMSSYRDLFRSSIRASRRLVQEIRVSGRCFFKDSSWFFLQGFFQKLL